MQCPACPEIALVMSDRQGIEIDYCPKCRGVWLDRGELDKIIERSGSVQSAPTGSPIQSPPPSASQPYVARPDFDDSDWGKRQGNYGQRHKSWLKDIFD